MSSTASTTQFKKERKTRIDLVVDLFPLRRNGQPRSNHTGNHVCQIRKTKDHLSFRVMHCLPSQTNHALIKGHQAQAGSGNNSIDDIL